MIVFVVNCGSSSIKYQLINMEGERVMAKGLIERIGMEGSTLKHTPAGKYTIDLKEEIPDHKVGIRLAIKALTSKEYGVIKDMSEIDAVGHRVVHGGERFTDSVLITSDVLRGIEACCEIAPLHNPPNLYGINACMEIMRGTPQVAVFDTAFHQTMPKVAYLYGLPYEMYVKYGVRRYGFHGTSHKYVALRAAELMQEHMNDLRIISCHLGNGASIAAIKYGKSIDTSMGYTPLEGLIMGTRSGEIDPAIIPFLMEKENVSLYNCGQNIRCFTYIDDIVEGLIYAVGCKRQLINICNVQPVTTMYFASLVKYYKPIEIELINKKRDFDNLEQSVNRDIYLVPLSYTSVEDGVKKIFDERKGKDMSY